jgi:hypothetical protein
LLLLGVVVLIALIVTTSAVTLALVAEARTIPSVRTAWSLDRLALVVVTLLVVLIASRSLLFGVDTAAYVLVLDSYCAGQGIDQLGLSFALSARMLNWMMLGACDERLLPMAWVLAVVIGILLGAGPLGDKLRYLAVLLVSLVGIELTTNALRQGLSVALVVAALSWWPRHRILSSGLAVTSVVLHSSSGLVLLAFVAAGFRWRWFALGGGAAVLLVISALQREVAIGPVGLFLYEVQKYLAHQSDEIWIRVLSLTSLAAILVVPWMAAGSAERGAVQMSTGPYARAVKLAASSIPFLFLPYFGYRYVYGILPVVLWLVMRAASQSARLSTRVFYSLLFINACLLGVWSFGSSYMQSVPFLE